MVKRFNNGVVAEWMVVHNHPSASLRVKIGMSGSVPLYFRLSHIFIKWMAYEKSIAIANKGQFVIKRVAD